MKKNVFLIAGFIIGFSVAAQKPAQKSSATPSIKLKNHSDSIQYALGAYMGRYMLMGGFQTVDLNYFLPGLNDAYTNKPKLISDSLSYAMIANYQTDKEKQRGKALEQELFNVLKDKPGVGKLPSGVQYLVIKPGPKGEKPLETDTVVIHFKGTLADGSVFENTFLKNTPSIATPASMIPGLSEVIQLMTVGATWEAFIPSAMAYAEKGNGKIPPNSALLITTELLEIRKRK